MLDRPKPSPASSATVHEMSWRACGDLGAVGNVADFGVVLTDVRARGHFRVKSWQMRCPIEVCVLMTDERTSNELDFTILFLS